MLDFHRHLWAEGLTPDSALAAARRDAIARERSGSKRGGPVAWAGFLLTVRSW